MALTLGILALVEAKPGKEADVEAFVKGGQAIVEQEPGTRVWYGFQGQRNDVRDLRRLRRRGGTPGPPFGSESCSACLGRPGAAREGSGSPAGRRARGEKLERPTCGPRPVAVPANRSAARLGHGDRDRARERPDGSDPHPVDEGILAPIAGRWGVRERAVAPQDESPTIRTADERHLAAADVWSLAVTPGAVTTRG